jgi:hypothetical protein
MAQWVQSLAGNHVIHLIIGSNPRRGIFEIISKNATGLSRIYNTVRIPYLIVTVTF